MMACAQQSLVQEKSSVGNERPIFSILPSIKPVGETFGVRSVENTLVAAPNSARDVEDTKTRSAQGIGRKVPRLCFVVLVNRPDSLRTTIGLLARSRGVMKTKVKSLPPDKYWTRAISWQ